MKSGIQLRFILRFGMKATIEGWIVCESGTEGSAIEKPMTSKLPHIELDLPEGRPVEKSLGLRVDLMS